MVVINKEDFIEAYRDMLENYDDGITLGFTEDKVEFYPSGVTPNEEIFVDLDKEDIYDAYLGVYDKIGEKEIEEILNDLVEDLCLYGENVPEVVVDIL